MTPKRLSRDSIIDAYLRVVEQGDGDAVTLRRLGQAMGVDATAIYRHFRSKDELLAAAADRVLYTVVEDVDLSGPWKEQLRQLFLALRRVYLQHPRALLALQLEPPVLEYGFINVERAVTVLTEAGLDPAEVAVTYEALETYVIGATLFDANATEESLERWRRVFSGLAPDRFPTLAHMGDRLYLDPDAAFLYGLDLMLDSVEARLASSATSTTTAVPVAATARTRRGAVPTQLGGNHARSR